MMMATLRMLVGQSKMLQRSRAMLLEMEPGQSYPSAFYYTAATMLHLNMLHCALCIASSPSALPSTPNVFQPTL